MRVRDVISEKTSDGCAQGVLMAMLERKPLLVLTEFQRAGEDFDDIPIGDLMVQ